MTSNKQLQDLTRSGGVAATIDAARRRKQQLLDALRAQPYEDLGFARVDHHRAVRQGFPEVILGLGKTPAQIAAIAAEIVAPRLDAAGDARERRRVRRRARDGAGGDLSRRCAA